jgi:hypothetical protein
VVGGISFLTCQRDVVALKKECIWRTLRTDKILDFDAGQCSVTDQVPGVIFVIIPSWYGWWQKLISILGTVISTVYTATMSKVPQSLSYIYICQSHTNAGLCSHQFLQVHNARLIKLAT